METFTAFLRQITQLFTWWVMVAPWEQALRVRAGRHVTRLGAGCHLKLPFLDTVYVQSDRLRVTQLPIQTVTTKDGKTLAVAGALAYSVRDITQLYRRLHHAEDTLRNLGEMAIAGVAAETDAAQLTPAVLSVEASARIKFDQYGLADASIRVTDFAFMRAYRLISDARWGGYGASLSTENKPA